MTSKIGKDEQQTDYSLLNIGKAAKARSITCVSCTFQRRDNLFLIILEEQEIVVLWFLLEALGQHIVKTGTS